MIFPDIGYKRTAEGVIISTDDRHYQEILRKRKEAEEHAELNNQLESLQNELAELKELFLKAIGK